MKKKTDRTYYPNLEIDKMKGIYSNFPRLKMSKVEKEENEIKNKKNGKGCLKFFFVSLLLTILFTLLEVGELEIGTIILTSLIFTYIITNM